MQGLVRLIKTAAYSHESDLFIGSWPLECDVMLVCLLELHLNILLRKAGGPSSSFYHASGSSLQCHSFMNRIEIVFYCFARSGNLFQWRISAEARNLCVAARSFSVDILLSKGIKYSIYA